MIGRTGIIAACAAVLVFGLWLAYGRSAVKEVVYPVENGRVRFMHSVGARISGFFKSGSVAAENERLKIENSALRMLRIDVARLTEENDRLRSMLELDSVRKNFPKTKWICAPVLSRNGAAGISGLIRLGRGSAHGVTTNATVAVPDGLVGRVEQVSPSTSDVRIITDPSVRVACEIEIPDDSFGAIRGILSGGGVQTSRASADASLLYVIEPLRVRHLKRRPRLPARARVITSGLGGIFPRGLTVGFLIDGQDENETALEREGDVIPAVDFPALEHVFIRREN